MTDTSITVITGVSTAGKSTLCNGLRRRVPQLTVTEVDDEQRPPVGTKYWRRYRIEWLMHNAAAEDDPVVLCGALWPHEVLACEAYDPNRVRFLILELADRVMERRLRARCGKTADIDMLLWVNRKLADALRRQAIGLKDAQVLDVSRLSRRRVLDEVVTSLKWIEWYSKPRVYSSCL